MIKFYHQGEQGMVLLNMMFILLFFNISFVAIIGYSQSLKMDFQRLIHIQQTGYALFVFLEQTSDESGLTNSSLYNLKIVTQLSLQSKECQKREGVLADNYPNSIRLYHWICN